ncbi:MAG: 50S ribosomal protein L24 [Planctomycetaceae bacterium]|nr:50S ribosomal protein L24 [Planctomycetaceae bacterium]MBQ2822291.1 50S ribosomal protein L24 [Thermoguttaceae bacterium]
MRIRKGDKVKVISGRSKGVESRVASIDREAGKVVVEGVNTVTKHIRPNKQNPQGGRLEIDKPISMSNVMVVCEACGKASRMGARVTADGTKERYCKKCGAGNGQISKAQN